MAFMWRLYIPMTNRFRLAMIFISHRPLDGNCTGVDGVKRGRPDSTLTKRTTPPRIDCPSKGFFEIRRAMSRPGQTTISATNGSLRATSPRAWAWVIGCRRISVPAVPILTAPRCFSDSASLVGRNVLWPPTFTPLKKTTSATRFPSTSPRVKLSSACSRHRPLPPLRLLPPDPDYMLTWLSAAPPAPSDWVWARRSCAAGCDRCGETRRSGRG